MNPRKNVTQYFSFASFHFYTFFWNNKREKRRKKLIPVVQILTVKKKVSRDEFEGNKRYFLFVIFFDVSLMNELYWHLGDIGNEYNLFSGLEEQGDFRIVEFYSKFFVFQFLVYHVIRQ